MSRSDLCAHRILRAGSRWGACAWALAWSAFGLFSAAAEGPGALPWAAGLVVTTGAVVFALWHAPRTGGAGALSLSLAAAFFFRDPFARWFLAAPLAALGFASILGASRLEPDTDPGCPGRVGAGTEIARSSASARARSGARRSGGDLP